MIALAKYLFLILKLGVVATLLLVGYEACLAAGVSYLGTSYVPAGVAFASLAWLLMGALVAMALLGTKVDAIGLGGLCGMVAMKASVEAFTGECLGGVPPALLGAAAATSAVLAHMGLPRLERPRGRMLKFVLPPAPSSLGGPAAVAA